MVGIGKVVRLNDRRFGFVEIDGEPGSSVFCHKSDLDGLGWTDELKGKRVRFEAFEGPNGWRAKWVRPAGVANDV